VGSTMLPGLARSLNASDTLCWDEPAAATCTADAARALQRRSGGGAAGTRSTRRIVAAYTLKCQQAEELNSCCQQEGWMGARIESKEG
jgi:hypothetical protein